MCHGHAPAPDGHHRGTQEEGSLSTVTFVGSFPTADFPTDPALPEVAFVGRSNVGKSSLINRLIGRRSLAHTSRTPGKTRTCNVFELDGTYFLVDLPGYGYAKISKKDRRGFSKLIRSYLSQRGPLIGVIWLLDIRREPSRDDLAMADLLAQRGVPVLVTVTKADKMGRGRRRSKVAAILEAIEAPADQCVVTSAVTREGIDELRDSVSELVDSGRDD